MDKALLDAVGQLVGDAIDLAGACTDDNSLVIVKRMQDALLPWQWAAQADNVKYIVIGADHAKPSWHSTLH
jgi:hypothetical protein